MPSQISDPLAPYPDLTLPMIEERQVFIDLVDPALFRNQLVQLYLKYMINKPEELPADFADMMESLSFFLQFLTKVEGEIKTPAP